MLAEILKTPQALAAIIQGVLSFLGVLITGGIAIAIWNRNRNKERQDRRDLKDEKRLDLLRALWSDISPVWQGLYLLGGLDSRLAGVRARFREAEAASEDFVPFVTKVAGTLFLNDLTDQLVYLETHEIGPVVEFYHQIKNSQPDGGGYTFGPLQGSGAGAAGGGASRIFVRVDHQAMVNAEAALRVIEVSLGLPAVQRLASKKTRLSPGRLQ